jgi:hypothetical protein
MEPRRLTQCSTNTTGERWLVTVHQTVYNDGVISVGLVSSDEADVRVALRWLKPQPYTNKEGQEVEMTNVMGGETEWFILPRMFGAAIGRLLVEQRATGLHGFDDEGLAALVRLLVEDEELHDCMTY